MTDYKALVDQYKLHLKDMTLEEGTKQFDIVQLKYDGFWCMLHQIDGMMNVVSSGGEVRHSFVSDVPPFYQDTIILAEWMYGTTWAINHKAVTGMEFAVHDIVRLNGKDLKVSYWERLQTLKRILYDSGVFSINWREVVTYPIEKTNYVWETFPNFEGVVFKQSSGYYGSPVGRTKRDFTMDYVFMGCNKGEGRYSGVAGSLKGGLYINGVLTEVCSVGGLTDEQRKYFWEWANVLIARETVFEAKGKGLFKSGALRHPAFLRVREDKKAHECIFSVV